MSLFHTLPQHPWDTLECLVGKVEAGMRGNIAERKEEIVLILSKKAFDLDASEERAEKTKEYYDSLFREKKTTTGHGLQTHQHKDKKLEKKSAGGVTPSARAKQKQAEKGMAKLDKTIMGTNSRDHEEQVARQKTKPPPHPDMQGKNKDDEDRGNLDNPQEDK